MKTVLVVLSQVQFRLKTTFEDTTECWLGRKIFILKFKDLGVNENSNKKNVQTQKR